MGKQEQKDPEVAGTEEVKEAISSLSSSDLKKLHLCAGLYIRKVGRAAAGRFMEDLIGEALLATLDGRRSWKKHACDFVWHLTETMRSITSSWAKSLQSEKNEEPLLDSEISVDTEEGGCWSPIDEVLSPNPGPEQIVGAKEQIQKIRDYFAGDREALDVLDGLQEEMRGPEIKEILDIDQTKYETIMKKIRRAAIKLLV